MKMQNSLSPTTASKKKETFSMAVTGDSLQNLIRKSVPDAAAAARFTGTLISVVASNQQLQKCAPATIVAAALRGEGMGFVIGRDYYVVPFGDTAVYVPGYKGLLNLLLSSGEVADADVVEVREGEIVGRDKRTKRLQFDFSVYETDSEMLEHPVIGYYAYMELLSGYFRFEYMSVEEILAHAERYSKSFSIDTYTKLENGVYSAEQAERIRSTSPWYSTPETMFKKTVMRKLLNSGFVPLANSAKIRAELSADTAVENGDIIDLGITNETVVESTAEVVDAPTQYTASESVVEPFEPSDDKVHGETTKRATRKPKTAPNAVPDAAPATTTHDDEMGDDYASFQQSFFGGDM